MVLLFKGIAPLSHESLSHPSHYCYCNCKGDKIRCGYTTLAFLGAQKWAELLHDPCVLRGPQQQGQNQKWLHNPSLGNVDS